MHVFFSFLILFLLVPEVHGFCDREIISKALLKAEKSQLIAGLKKGPRPKINRPVSISAQKVLRKIQGPLFGSEVLTIEEDIPFAPPMSSIDKKGTIRISRQTLDSLNQRLKKPSDGMAFIIAHEIAHLIQDVSHAEDPKEHSPHGFERVTQAKEQEFNRLHAETDCIAVEILHRSGFKLTDDVFTTLQIIKDECRTQMEVKFCLAADEQRQMSVRQYIKKYYTKGPSVPSLSPALKKEDRAKSAK